MVAGVVQRVVACMVYRRFRMPCGRVSGPCDGVKGLAVGFDGWENRASHGP
jgi:hypothetical protein